MKKTKFLLIPVVGGALCCLINCGALHFHDQSSKWEYDENSHWQVCSECGKPFGNDSHSFNKLDDTCLICNYHDPVFKVDKTRTLTGLTTYGKTKDSLDPDTNPDFENVDYIGKAAFKGCNAKNIVIPREVFGVCEGYNEGIPTGCNVTTEEEKSGEEVKWYSYKGIYYKFNITENCEAVVDNVAYLTLKDAIEAVKYNDTDVFLLKSVNALARGEGDITVSKSINLKSQDPSEIRSVAANFNIEPSGILKISDTVKYDGGEVQLMTSRVEEQHSTSEHDLCLTSGTVAVEKGDSTVKPVIKSYYVDNFDREYQKYAYETPWSIQKVPESLLLSPVEYYACGVFKFNFGSDYNNPDIITGLTTFGMTASDLTITRVRESTDPIEEKREKLTLPVNTCDNCFHRYGKEEIKLVLGKKLVIAGEFQKGKFTNIILGDGVKHIGRNAFSTPFDAGQMDKTLREEVAKIMCPLVNVDLGSSVNSIGDGAFRYCSSITTVNIGENSALNSIGSRAFGDCFNLTSVDFSNATGTSFIIYPYAFENCSKFTTCNIRPGDWSIEVGKDKYVSYPDSEMTPGNVAYWLRTKHLKNKWEAFHYKDNEGVYCFDPDDKDSEGYHHHTEHFGSFNFALSSELVKDNWHMYFTEATKQNGNDLYPTLVSPTFKKLIWYFVDPALVEKHGYAKVNSGDSYIVGKEVKFDEGGYAIFSEYFDLDGHWLLDKANSGFAIKGEKKEELKGKLIVKDGDDKSLEPQTGKIGGEIYTYYGSIPILDK